MSVKHALLALLSTGPATTYQLRGAFDASTGQVWPLNIGQASTTLARCERDGLVVRDPEAGEDATAGQWNLTPAGREELATWFTSPLVRTHPDRHELVLKLALAASVPDVDLPALVQTQRDATMSMLHDTTRARRAVPPGDLAAALVLDHHLFTLEAELRWLEDVEGSVQRTARERRSTPTSSTPAGAETSDAPRTASAPTPAATSARSVRGER